MFTTVGPADAFSARHANGSPANETNKLEKAKKDMSRRIAKRILGAKVAG
jgi:hypothetical protein